MSKKFLLIILGILLSFSCFSGSFAAISLPGNSATIIADPSIEIIQPSGSDPIIATRTLGWKILGLAKMVISGFALIYLVLIGVYMIVFSENEDRIKTQRKQIIYALIGFLFLNIPGVMYQIFFSTPKDGTIPTPGSPWQNIISSNAFWDTYGIEWFFGNLIAFLQVFIFGVAVLTFTWWLFQMIVSGGDEEKQKKAKGRITYGILWLIFLGFVKAWSVMISSADFTGPIKTVGNKLLGVALYFAGPVAIFFIIWGAYYYITSAGDEERTKKGKAILVNTFIATIILLASYSFLTDLVNFKI